MIGWIACERVQYEFAWIWVNESEENEMAVLGWTGGKRTNGRVRKVGLMRAWFLNLI